MSDEFDKEAEREKLREKYADDDEKREHTQRLSELLLNGATMTNRHCEECGDPIFRQNGQEFCPSCNVASGGDTPDDTDVGAGNARERAETGPDGAESARTIGGVERPDETPSGDVDRNANDEPPIGVRSPSGGTKGADPGREMVPRASEGSGSDSGTVDDGVAVARESLARTLARFARAAERTEDPRRAREHLRAAREAAETLSALE